MTAAAQTSRAFAHPEPTMLRWQRSLAVLAVCLPVPICAASGLSLPLPATVERLAASLVPWADAGSMRGNEALAVGAGGAIVAGSDEQSGDSMRLAGQLPTTTVAPAEGGSRAARTPKRSARSGSAAGTKGEQLPSGGGAPGPAAGADPAPRPASADPAAPGGSEPTQPSAPAPSSPAPAPAPAPAPTQPSSSGDADPVAAVEPVVEGATAPLEPVVTTVTETTEKTLAPVTGAVKGVGG